MLRPALGDLAAERASMKAKAKLLSDEADPDAAKMGNKILSYCDDAVRGLCFTAGTPVLTENGIKPIENINKKDKVWSFDVARGKKVLQNVKESFQKKTEQLVHLFVGKDTIHTTPDHSFYNGKDWIKAQDIKKGMKVLLLSTLLATVDSTFAQDTICTVYNFEVETTHNYYVGNQHILAHNQVCGWAALEAKLNGAGFNRIVGWLNDESDIIKAKYVENFAEAPMPVHASFNAHDKSLFRDWLNGIRKGYPDASGSSKFTRYHYDDNEDFITHSMLGKFAEPKSPKGSFDPSQMKGGGHGQINKEYLTELKFAHKVEHTFDNGVETGSVAKHAEDIKKSGIGQSWFPKSITEADVLQIKNQALASGGNLVDPLTGAFTTSKTWASVAEGEHVFFNYKGIRVGIIKTKGNPGTAYPDRVWQLDKLGNIIKNPK